MKNKGFTLIELLAVIVILAIIALIATPIILNIIEDAKTESTKRSAENYVKAVETEVVRKNLTSEFNPTTCDVSGTTLSCAGYEPITVEIDGATPTTGTITFENHKAKTYTLGYEGKTVTKASDGTVTVGSTNEEITLKPGLYDANDNLVASWDELVNTYGLDVESDIGNIMEYATSDPHQAHNVLQHQNLRNGVKLIIPDSVTRFGSGAFADCDTLKYIIYSDEVALSSGCFADCNSLLELKISEKQYNQLDMAYSCDSLETIYLPSNASYYSYFIVDVTTIKRIYYNNTIEAWRSTDSSYLSANVDYTVYCTDGTITKSGTVTYY